MIGTIFAFFFGTFIGWAIAMSFNGHEHEWGKWEQLDTITGGVSLYQQRSCDECGETEGKWC